MERDLAARAQQASPATHFVMIDLRDQPRLPAALEAFSRQHPAVPVLLLLSSLDPAFMLEAMRAGVKECLQYPVLGEELDAAIARIAASRDTGPGGDVFAFLGAKGGVGTTTAAVNVATELAHLHTGSVLLVDLHLAYGDAAIYLGAEPRFSIADALENTHRLDSAFLKSLCVKTKAGPELLAAPDRNLALPVDAGRVRALIEAAARSYRYVVLDLCRTDPAVLDGLDPVKKILVIANQELATVRCASRMAMTLEPALRQGPRRPRGQPIRSERRHRPGGHRARRRLEDPAPAAVRLSRRPRGLNTGRPLALEQPDPTRRRPEGACARTSGTCRRRRAREGRQEHLRPADWPFVTANGGETMTLVPPTAARVDTRHPQYQELKSRVHQGLLNRLNLERLTRVSREEAEPEIRGVIMGMLDAESDQIPLSLFERQSLIGDVLNELFGLGPLEELLADPEISDILVNRFDQVYVERHGLLEPVDVVFKDDAHLLRIIERIVSSVGRRIDESSPMVDARLADGSRVNAIIPPLALDGPVLSIRRFRTDRLGPQDLVERDSLTQPMLDFVAAAVACRTNVIVSGGTGAGKTTLLNVLSGVHLGQGTHRHRRGRGGAHACGSATSCASRRGRPTSKARAPSSSGSW